MNKEIILNLSHFECWCIYHFLKSGAVEKASYDPLVSAQRIKGLFAHLEEDEDSNISYRPHDIKVKLVRDEAIDIKLYSDCSLRGPGRDAKDEISKEIDRELLNSWKRINNMLRVELK